MQKYVILGSLGLILSLFGCATPRQTMSSPQVTPQGKFSGGYEFGWQAPTAVIGELSRNVINRVDDYIDEDSVNTDDTLALKQVSAMLAAQGVDPLGTSSGIYFAYGLIDHLEVGYQYLFTGHSLWLRYQLTDRKPSTWQAVVGLHGSKQSYDLPSYMEKVKKAFGYELDRKDLILPITIGRYARWKIMTFEWGAVAQVQYSQIHYGFDPTWLYNYVDDNGGRVVLEQIPEQTNSFWSFGGSGNGRIGIGPVFLGAGLGYYYQDYGDYKLPLGQSVHLSGGTVVFRMAIEMRFWGAER